ncbi:uncharacterized protein si:ch211-80h18.1 isoform X4 [Nothobranchius furzeri]|uniref:uncharacterized protein si:ch211-80h18.1 isoform X4 n=1 Tax=Nothobranchius furzeri TaxID=105023 RepID=UPI003904A0B1
MLPPNLLTVSIIVLLATAVSTAPVEEKELEEGETEVTEMVEGELSEEEEDDDDDSKSQDKIKAAQQTTMSAAPAGGSASSGQSVERGPHEGAAGGSPGHGGDISSVDPAAAGHPSSSSGSSGSAFPSGASVSAGSADSAGSLVSAGSVSSAGSIAVDLSGVSAGQTHPAGAKDLPASSHTGTNGAVGADLGSNGNGQKLLNGGGGGAGVDSQTGDLGSLGGGVSPLDYSGINDPSSHDYLLGLIGVGLVDVFGTDGHVNIPGHMTPPTHLDVSVIGSGVTAAPSVKKDILHSTGGTGIASIDHYSASSVDQSGAGDTSLTSGSDQSLSSSLSDSSSSAASSSSSSSDSAAYREHSGGADSLDTMGNGRQTHLTDTNREAVTSRTVSISEPQTLQTDLPGGPESVTGQHIDVTASGLQLGRDVTELMPISTNTDSADSITNTLSPVSGVYSHTDQVTMVPASTGTDTVPAGPTGTPLDSSHPAVTDHAQMAGSITEQYNPSGQGPEGAENMELEDTC